MPSIVLTKCQGTGNDFVLLDNRAGARFAYPALARAACDRRFGVGADGLLVLLRAAPGAEAEVAMRIFNADGSEAEMCGNGIRCIARYLAREAGERRELAVQTPTGVIHTQLTGAPGMVRVDMGTPALAQPLEASFEFRGRTLRYARVSMGNPHAVIFVDDALDAYPLEELAAAAAHASGEARGINVELARVAAGRIQMRIHERGVGETWACGTGACAAAAAAIATNRLASPIEITTRGGSVNVVWNGADQPALLTGPAEIVFETRLELAGDVLTSA
jgi:diaminopimelate epimerase